MPPATGSDSAGRVFIHQAKIPIIIALTPCYNNNHMSDTLFSKIIDREVPADIVYEDDDCLAFRDINPQAPTHILVVPKKPIPKVADAGADDKELLGHLLMTASRIAKDEGCGESFRLVINNGEQAGQSVFHLHVHILGGRDFSWPPG